MTPGIYRHYKGVLYHFIFLSTHTETGEPYMVYFNPNKPEQVWIRPLDMCEEEVIYQGNKTPRFDWISHLP
jgi:hypothetical protein